MESEQSVIVYEVGGGRWKEVVGGVGIVDGGGGGWVKSCQHGGCV